MYFKDRFDAGKKLAERLTKYKHKKDTLILAVPRGGLEIGHVLAKELHLPLDIIIVKKIPFPGNPEYAIGAVGINETVVNEEVIRAQHISQEYIDNTTKELRRTIKERYKKYRGKKPLPELQNKTIIVTDDGIATGYTLVAAVDVIRKQHPKKVVLAVPVAPHTSLDMFKNKVDEVVCLQTPELFFGVGQFYENFSQVDDEEVVRLLRAGNEIL